MSTIATPLGTGAVIPSVVLSVCGIIGTTVVVGLRLLARYKHHRSFDMSDLCISTALVCHENSGPPTVGFFFFRLKRAELTRSVVVLY